MPAKFFSRGVGSLALVLTISLVMSAVTILGAIVHKHATGDKSAQIEGDLNQNQLDALVQLLADEAYFAADDEEQSAQHAEEALELVRRRLRFRINELTQIEPCEATIEHVAEAILLSHDAIGAGLPEEKTAMSNWAMRAFHALIPDAALAQGSTFEEDGTDMFGNDITPREREMIADSSTEIVLQRAALAEFAQLIGFDDLAEDIRLGRYIQPVCIQLWDIGVFSTYTYDDGYGASESWSQEAKLRDVPIYKYDHKLNLPYMTKNFEEESTFLFNKGSYHDGSMTYPCKLEGNVKWKILMDAESVEDLWSYKIHFTVSPELSHLAGVRNVCADGMTSPSMAHGLFIQHTFEIPMIKFWRREAHTSSFSRTNAKDLGKGYVNLNFTPTRRITVKELKDMIYN